MKLFLRTFLIVLSSFMIQISLFSEDASLTQESIDKAKATESIKPTGQMIIKKIYAAAALIEKEGEACFSKFKGMDSEFIYAGTYIWIHSLTDPIIMLMHPMKPELEGKEISKTADYTGKYFFVEMNKLCKEKGQGWIDYEWPKPGETEPSIKLSFVKLAKHNGKEYVVGSGAYDL